MNDAPTLPKDINEPMHVYVRLPRCPRCGGLEFRGNHTTRRDKIVTVRHSRCKNCGQRVNIIRQ